MEKEYYGFIYITTNKTNGKRYIGKKTYDKKEVWKNYLGSGIALKNAIDKYGKENFSKVIIEECNTKDLLNEREKYWIEKYNATSDSSFYNIAPGGEGGNVTSGYSEDMLIKFYNNKVKGSKGIINQGKENPRAKKVICLNNGLIFDTTVIASRYGNTKDYCIQACCRGKSKTAGVSSENGEKLQWAYYNPSVVYEYIPFKRNYLENAFSKRIKCVETGIIYNRVKDGAKVANVNSATLSMHLSGKTKHCGGFHWVFV